MRPEQIVIGLVVFVMVIFATTVFISENVNKYKISNESMELLQESNIDIGEFANITQEQKDEVYSDKDTGDNNEANLIWGGYNTIKKADKALKTNKAVINTITKRSGIKGLSFYMNVGMLLIGILFLFFLAYYFRGYQPPRKD